MTGTSETLSMLEQSMDAALSRHWSAHSACEGKTRPDLWSELVELGLPAAELTAEKGGLDFAFGDIVPCFRAVGRALATTYINEFVVMGGWIVAMSTMPLAGEIAGRLASGEVRVALAFGEYGDGGHSGHPRTRATRNGDGWQIDGAKTVVIGGDRATHLIIPAMIAPDVQGAEEELGLFLTSTQAEGLSLDSIDLFDGSVAADFEFRALMVSAPSLMMQGAGAVETLALAMDRGRAALCHEIVGLIEAASEITLDYVKARRQFGQPIGAFQTMQHRMADMHMDLELARSCAELATSAIDPRSNAKERARSVSAAMAGICDCARKVGQSAVQAHGAIALTQEYVLGHYFKRLTLAARYLGDAEFHIDRYIDQGET